MSDSNADPSTVLVVAISTVGGAALGKAMIDRLDQGPVSFHVIVPERLPNQGGTWSTGQVEEDAVKRLSLLTELVASLGVEVNGEVTRLSDAADVIAEILQGRGDIDEIMVVQGSKGLKKWSDKHRVKRLDREVDLPVTQVDPDDVSDEVAADDVRLRPWVDAVGRSPETD